MNPLFDISGKRFNRLLVVSRSKNMSDGSAQWRCRCQCGKEIVVRAVSLRNGTTKSCGCLRVDKAMLQCQARRTHGQATRGNQSPEYKIWAGMIRRCENPHEKCFKNYGARGITVCAEWRDSFEAFYRDMGPRPAPHLTLERKKNHLGYFKDNCVWATKKEQAHNTRTTVMTVELAKEAKAVRDAGGNLSAWSRSKNIRHCTAWAAAIGKNWA